MSPVVTGIVVKFILAPCAPELSNRHRNVIPESTPGRSLFRGSIVGFCSCILRLDKESSSQCLIGSIFGAIAVVTRVICPLGAVLLRAKYDVPGLQPAEP